MGKNISGLIYRRWNLVDNKFNLWVIGEIKIIYKY